MRIMKNTDEQRTWIKKRKKCWRVLAGALCLSVLFTAYPNILGTFSVFAAEREAEELKMYAASGTEWTLDDNGLLTIESDAGMTNWSGNRKNYDSDVKSVVIKSGMTSIAVSAFYGCKNLKSIEIPNTVKGIGDRAFYDCISLTVINIETSSRMTSIGKNAFSGCKGLTGITIPSSVTSIGETAFYNCDSLTSITVPSGVTNMGTSVFKSCSSLQSVTLQPGMTSIGDSMFNSCGRLTSVTIPSSVTSIGSSAFGSCKGLTSITIPSGVTSIGGGAFSACSNLESITIPSGVTDIGIYGFSGCTKLTKVEMLCENPPTLGNNEVFRDCGAVAVGKKGILVPVGKADAYKTAGEWSTYEKNITDGTPEITAQPKDQTVQDGKSAAFSVTADAMDGMGTMRFQWQTDEKTGTFADIAGATSATYTFSSVNKSYDGYKYRCVVTNDRGTATSDEATLTVTSANYQVTLHGNGGSGGTDLTSYTYGIGATLPTDWTKTGYTFAGWYDNEGCSGTAVTNISGTDTGNKEYWAKWIDNITGNSGTITVEDDEENECSGALANPDDVKNKVDLTEQEKAKDVVIILRLTNVEKTADTSEKEKIGESLPEGNTLGTFLDIQLLKKIGETETPISNTNGEIGITFEVPEGLRNTDNAMARTYRIMRNHNGTVDTLNAVYNESTHMLTFQTDKFSAYALVYKDDKKNQTNPPAQPTNPPANPSTEESAEKPADKPTDTPDTPLETEVTGNAILLNAQLKVSQTGKKINVAWGKVAAADGYDVYVQYCGKSFTKKSITAIKGREVTEVVVKKINGKPLNLKKNYKVYILAYKLEGGKKVTVAKSITAHVAGRKSAKYTNVKAVKVNKSSYSLKPGQTATIKASTVLVDKSKQQLPDVHAKEFRYATSNKAVATVSKNGKITAVGKGTCTIYVYARNGYAKKITVVCS